MNNNINKNDNIYHIDEISISLFKLSVSGWVISNDGGEVIIHSNNLFNRVERFVRNDVNKIKRLDKDFNSGFRVTVFPIFTTIKINFKFEGCIEVYRLSGLKEIARTIKRPLKKIYKYYKNNGFGNTIKYSIHRLFPKKEVSIKYEEWFIQNKATLEELDMQKNHVFDYQPLISIVVPTYNTPVNFLNEMVESMYQQTYKNWELCIADGNSASIETIEALKKIEKEDSRIKIIYLEENYMISGNTNKALELVSGEFVALMDHDDLLEPNTLYEYVKVLNEKKETDFIYCDEDKITEDGKTYLDPHFKPDFSIDNLRCYNYITHFSMIRKSVLDQVGNFDSNCDGAQDYDMILRIVDVTNKIEHVSKVLYHWRISGNSTAQSASNKQYVLDAGVKALEKHLERNNLKATVTNGLAPTIYRAKYEIEGNPLVSIVICTKDHIDDLDTCIQSIVDKTTYLNYEIIVIENNSTSPDTFKYYDEIEKIENLKMVYWDDEFNYSAINNFGVTHANGEYIILLNNDIEVITPNWIEEMLMFAQRKDVGAVGAKLLYPDNTIQHAGVIIGIGGVAAHSHKNFGRTAPGHMSRLFITQNVSAVTAACLMIKKSIFEEVNGLTEEYKVAFNDVDFCLKVRKKGYLNVYTPFAELYHHESKSRGQEDTLEKQQRFLGEQILFKETWPEILENGDPFYNNNLTLTKEDFSLKQ